MPEESNTSDQRGGLKSAIAKKALAPIVASAATAGTAYLLRKGSEVWQEKLEPKVREKGGGRAVARETLEGVAGKVGGSTSDKLRALAGKLGDEGSAAASSPKASPSPASRPSDSASDAAAEEERRKRGQRRQQRRRTLEQAGSS
jgi:hypothetical protein